VRDHEWRRRAHALLTLIQRGDLDCDEPNFMGVHERTEVDALLDDGPSEVKGVVLATIPYVCGLCGIGATMNMETMNCAKCGCTLRKATPFETKLFGHLPDHVEPHCQCCVKGAPQGESFCHGGPCCVVGF